MAKQPKTIALDVLENFRRECAREPLAILPNTTQEHNWRPIPPSSARF